MPLSQTSQTVDPIIGRDVRDLRKAKGLTITRLAELTGLSTGYLSEIERGVSVPSERALSWIATALKVTPDWFRKLAPGADGANDDIVVRAGSHRAIMFQSGMREDLLTPGLGGRLELTRTTTPPGSDSGANSRSHVGEEAGFVLNGELTLWINDRKLVLRPGDSFAFDSREPHRVANLGTVDAVIIWAQTPPLI